MNAWRRLRTDGRHFPRGNQQEHLARRYVSPKKAWTNTQKLNSRRLTLPSCGSGLTSVWGTTCIRTFSFAKDNRRKHIFCTTGGMEYEIIFVSWYLLSDNNLHRLCFDCLRHEAKNQH